VAGIVVGAAAEVEEDVERIEAIITTKIRQYRSDND